MKTQIIVATAVMLLAAGQAQAQFGYYRPTTTASCMYSSQGLRGGYAYGPVSTGSYLAGYGMMLQGQGQYNLLTSQAAIHQQEARSRKLDNDLKATRTYFAKRDAHDDWVARHTAPQLTSQQLAAISHRAAPQPLTPRQFDLATGALHWPVALQAPQFAAEREVLEQLVAERQMISTAQSYALDAQIRQHSAALQSQLAAVVRDVPPMDFVAAKKFLDSLSHHPRLDDLRVATN